jgi:fused signal recognition particle receptor
MNPALVLTLIVLLAVVLIVGGLVLSRRSQRAAGTIEAPPVAPPVRPPDAAPAVGTVEESATVEVVEEITEEPVVEAPVVEERPRLRDRLGRTRAALAGAFTGIAGRATVDEETWEELEEALILATLDPLSAMAVADQPKLDDLKKLLPEDFLAVAALTWRSGKDK